MKKVVLAAVAAAAWGVHAADILIEAEAFDSHGGWTLDAQHMGEMGSPYLLAHGLGKPVADARALFTVPEEGEYSVYVRTRNWTAPWSDAAAGTFKLEVNGAELETVFGDGDGAWRWVGAADKVKLQKGVNSLVLKDLTGFDGRIDAVYFTGGAFREPERGTREIICAGRYDLVVCGGGVAGVCAALSAARSGLKVALIQDRPVLGGNNSSEIRVHLGGHVQCGKYPRLGDVVAEIGPEHGGNARSAAMYEDGKKLAVVKAEKNISLFLNTRAMQVEKDGDKISAVVAADVRSGRRLRFAAPLFLDATGDGTIGFAAGADWRMGRESKAESGEKNAPAKADNLTMGSSCQWRAVDVSEPDSFPEEPWMVAFDDKTATARLKGDWDWEVGLGRDQIAEAERIRDYGMLVAYSNWAFVKNRGKKKDEFKLKKLDWVASVAGKRESRRLLGDVILDEEDLMDSVPYPDGTCLTSWSIDLHYPRGEKDTGFKGESFRSSCEQWKIVMYPIPYRCFYSRNVPNLFMAGRNISVTHIALGSVRVMRTTGMMGEVVGMAAAVCRERGCLPRDVYAKHFKDLEARMTAGAGAGLGQTLQVYNIHPTYGYDAKDKVERRRHALMGWAETSEYMARPDVVKWSYPPLAWPRWEAQRARAESESAGRADADAPAFATPLKSAEFRGRDGKVFTVTAAACGGVPCVRGEGFETRDAAGRWTACEVFDGSDEAPAHRTAFFRREFCPAYSGGKYDAGGLRVGRVYCRAKKRPEMRAGVFAGGMAPRLLEPTELPGEWRTCDTFAFRYLDFRGDVEDIWIAADEALPIRKRNYGDSVVSRVRIWNICASTVRLCTRRFFVSSPEGSRVPSPRDAMFALLADSSVYVNAAAARFTLDALLSVLAPTSEDAAYLAVDFALYRRLYGDIGFIRSRWEHFAAAVDSAGCRGPLAYAAYASAAGLAAELGETEAAARWRRRAGELKEGLNVSGMSLSREEKTLAVVFGALDAAGTERTANELAVGGRPRSTRLAGLEALALAVAGRRDEALALIDSTWGSLAANNLLTTPEFALREGAGFDGVERSCHISGTAPVWLLPRLKKAAGGFDNPLKFGLD